EHSFPQRGSLCLAVYDQPDRAPTAKAQATCIPLEASHFAGEWDMELLDPNALTLDTCDIWFDGVLNAEHESISVVQNRALAFGRPVDIQLRFGVQVAEGYTPQGELFLVVEQPANYQIFINGKPLTQHDCGYYRDISFRKLDIAGLLAPGANEIILQTRFQQSPQVYENLKRAQAFESEKNKLTYDSEVEAIYLVGGFGVATPGTYTDLPQNALRYSGPFILTPLPGSVPAAELTAHGLPFFNGKLRLTKRIALNAAETANRSFRYEEQLAHVARLTVNGHEVHTWLWRPFEVELTSLLQTGENVFTLELTNGLRNLLGPHHLEQGESYSVHPGQFFKEPNIWGFSSPWNADYCLMPFGIIF
ncbi:MAG: hypothetical protein LLG44_07995, partial [Chloroflexi bacterium]|nr:hypothetical protein [Chloroflexota bacterium]